MSGGIPACNAERVQLSMDSGSYLLGVMISNRYLTYAGDACVCVCVKIFVLVGIPTKSKMYWSYFSFYTKPAGR